VIRNPDAYETEQLFSAISEYEDLAHAGRAYPDHRVNRLFNDLKNRYLLVSSDWTNEKDFRGDLTLIAKEARGIEWMFKHALTRADKVIAIDSLMSFIHCCGHAICDMYAIDYDNQGELNRVRKVVYERLHKLFIKRNPRRRNPVDDWNEERFKHEMFAAIGQYEMLARRGKLYPDSKVDELFTELFARLNATVDVWYQYRSSKSITIDRIIKVHKMFQKARIANTRVAKVFAIDALMHLEHFDGMVIMPMYRVFDYDRSGSIQSEVRRRLEDLHARRNPVVFHGTVAPVFTQFRTHPSEFKSYYGRGESILGAAFSESREVAASYPVRWRAGETKRVITAKLNIDHPAQFRSLKHLSQTMGDYLEKTLGTKLAYGFGKGFEHAALFRKHLESQGYDGITFLEGPSYKTSTDKARVWIAFHPEQIEIIANENPFKYRTH
jgi:hypothetical protein